MEFDVVIVGAGIAGLTTAIHLKQLANKYNKNIEICILEKGSEVGAHIISGNIFQPDALFELFPDCLNSFPDDPVPLDNKVEKNEFNYLINNYSINIPHFLLPSQMQNYKNYIISLSELCKWLSRRAEEMDINIFPGFSVSDIIYDDNDNVIGVNTSDVGLNKQSKPKQSFQLGMRILGKQTVFAEGCRGSLSEKLIKKFDLRSNCCPQTYGIGLKEIWEIDSKNFDSGYVLHTVGYPLSNYIYGGGFLYHKKPNLLHIGLIIGLDYQNPYINPYNEFQKWKLHPKIKKFLKNAKCISYGARCINEGGFQSIPKLTFNGGMLVGDSAGFLNVAKIKGSHTAMKSGILAAKAIKNALITSSSKKPIQIIQYEQNIHNSSIYHELKQVRNCKPSFKYGGLIGGLIYSGISLYAKGMEPWTFRWTKEDHQYTKNANNYTEIQYPKSDRHYTFDILDNLIRSGTNHEHDQPSHLKIKEALKDSIIPISYQKYAAPETRFCPAKVYEIINDENDGKPKLQINAQNCLHCKCCSIKTPLNYIDWTVPEGGGGPLYTNM